MTKKVAVVVIHGIGSQDKNYDNDFHEEIFQKIRKLKKNPEEIAWGRVLWADVLSGKQEEYLERAINNHDLDYTGLRKFIVNALGDATAYRKVDKRENGKTIRNEDLVYEEIHKCVSNTINEIYERDLNSIQCPLIFIAHSLGGHIMSNYIWDRQKYKDKGNDFENMKTLNGIITFGCNIPLFTLAYDEPEPIEFPLNALPKKLRDKSKWKNFYDPDDILGYPLRAIGPKFQLDEIEDIPINVGSIFSSWQPMSHNGYWTDNDFTKPSAEFIASFL